MVRSRHPTRTRSPTSNRGKTQKRSIGDRLASHCITGVADGGREQLVDTILDWYEHRQALLNDNENAMDCVENDRCLLVGYFIDLTDKSHKALWNDVAAMSLGKPATRARMRSCLLELKEKELLALLGIAVQSTLKARQWETVTGAPGKRTHRK